MLTSPGFFFKEANLLLNYIHENESVDDDIEDGIYNSLGSSAR